MNEFDALIAECGADLPTEAQTEDAANLLDLANELRGDADPFDNDPED